MHYCSLDFTDFSVKHSRNEVNCGTAMVLCSSNTKDEIKRSCSYFCDYIKFILQELEEALVIEQPPFVVGLVKTRSKH